MNRTLLVVVDMQNDFIDGALSNPEAQKVVPQAVKYIKEFVEENGRLNVILTADTHRKETYLDSMEGKYLPVEHCIARSHGWRINKDISEVTKGCLVFNKDTFGSKALPEFLANVGKGNMWDRIIFIGFCTDICVVSNALIFKAHFPEIEIAVIPELCAGTTPENHEAAINVMRSCQVEIINL